MYLGEFSGEPCFISLEAPNQSVCLTGISGSGKTCRLQKIELEAMKAGTTVIVLDVHQTHSEGQIFRDIREEYVKNINRIHAVEEGLNLGLFKPIRNGDGQKESFVNIVSSAVQALSAGQRFGVAQIEALRGAVIELVRRDIHYENEAKALSEALLEQETPAAKAVYGRLWPLLNCGIFKVNEKSVQAGKINVFDFSGLSESIQRALAELLLSCFWRRMLYGEVQKEWGNVCLVLDEFHNLSLKREAPLLNFLREGRKYNVNLAIATQTLSVFPQEILSILGQMASRLYFQPSTNEIRKIAKEIGGEEAERYRKILSGLRRGESLAVGNFYVKGVEIRRPIILR